MYILCNIWDTFILKIIACLPEIHIYLGVLATLRDKGHY